jgi:membrane protein
MGVAAARGTRRAPLFRELLGTRARRGVAAAGRPDSDTVRIKGYDVVALLKKTWKEIGEDHVAVYAEQMAYTLFFSIFPLLLFFAALLSLVLDRGRVTAMLAGATASLPSGVGTLVRETASNVISARGAPGLLSFGLLAAAWSGSSIFGSFRQALNAAYDVTEQRPWWKQYLLQLAMLVVVGVALLLATLVLIDGAGIVSWVGDRVGLGAGARIVWTVLQIPLALAAVVAVMWAQYYFLPHVERQRKIFPLVGAVIATTLWIAATLLFRLYVQRFHALNPAYGAIGAIMVLLTWMYYSSFVLLAVGELISELEGGVGKGGDRPAAEGATATEAVPHERSLVPIADVPRGDRWVARTRGGDGRATPDGSSRLVAEGTSNGRAATDGSGTGIMALVRSLADGAGALVRQELRLARVETAEAVEALGRGSALVAVGGVLALLGAVTVIAGLVLVLGDQWLPADAYWAAALVVAAAAAGTAAWCVGRARRLLSTSSLAPYETVETLEEDAEWLKEPTTSGTTW